MSKLKGLKEQRSTIYKSIRSLADTLKGDKTEFTTEERGNWEKVNKDYDALSSQIEREERMLKLETEQKSIGRDDDADLAERRTKDGELTDAELGIGESEQRSAKIQPAVFNLALRGWMLRQSGLELEERHVKAAKAAGVNLRQKFLDIKIRQRPMSIREYRALSVVDQSLGGSTVAPTFSNAFEVAMLAFGGMRLEAQILRTSTGAPMPWPTANDTGNEGYIVGENTVPPTNGSANADPTFGSKSWGAYKYTSGIIQVGQELLEDSAFDIASEVGSMIGERIARRQNRDFTVGDAAGKPNGLITAAPVGVTCVSSTAFTADELVSLVHSVDPAYRQGAKFMFSDTILLTARKLKDSQGRYLFQDPVGDEPPTFWGKPYTINQHMSAALTTGQLIAAFGQLTKYKIRDVRTIRLRRLVERYADSDQEGFVAFMRSDGNLLDAGVSPVKTMKLL